MLPKSSRSSLRSCSPWPKSNEVVELGVLTIDKTVPDSLEAQKKLLFLPGQLIEGIEPSDDPLTGVRDGAFMRCRFRAATRESNILQTESSQALLESQAFATERA